MNWFKIKKGVHQGCILSPCLFKFIECIMWKARVDESQPGIKAARRNIDNLRYADDSTLMAESEEELRSFLMRVKGEWKRWLKTQYSQNQDHDIWSYHFIANRWGRSRNSDRFYHLGLQNHSRWSLKLKEGCIFFKKLWQT